MNHTFAGRTMSSTGQSGPSLGQRVEYQGYHGTVRFVGELENQPGSWVGVEWDDPSRGKHDGSHNGVSYFQTRYNSFAFPLNK